MPKSTPFKMSLWLLLPFFFFACNDDDVKAPDEENEVEEFTYIEFVFTNTADASDIRKGIWEDEDGFGPIPPRILQHPTLKVGTTYRLTFVMENRLVTPVENVLLEIQDEDDEHQVFFAFDEGLFASPQGVGNIANRDGAINYEDFDDNGLPVGLRTLWTTAELPQTSKFRAVLAHQPGVKSATSRYDSDDIDWDIVFDMSLSEE